jgi:hypothetical protein
MPLIPVPRAQARNTSGARPRKRPGVRLRGLQPLASGEPVPRRCACLPGPRSDLPAKRSHGSAGPSSPLRSFVQRRLEEESTSAEQRRATPWPGDPGASGGRQCALPTRPNRRSPARAFAGQSRSADLVAHDAGVAGEATSCANGDKRDARERRLETCLGLARVSRDRGDAWLPLSGRGSQPNGTRVAPLLRTCRCPSRDVASRASLGNRKVINRR